MATSRSHVTNPTKVVRLPATVVELALHVDESFTATFSGLSDYVADHQSRVWISVGAGGTSRSYDFGTVGHITAPSDLSFDGLDGDKPRVYRLLVWDPSTKRVIASNERLRARDATTPADREPLLPVRPTDLGQLVWKLGLHPDVQPELLVNKRVPKLKQRLLTKPELRGSIVPEATRQCLMHVFDSRDFDETDAGAWQSKWLRFADGLASRPPEWDGDELDREEARKWADEVVAALSREHGFARLLVAEWSEEDND